METFKTNEIRTDMQDYTPTEICSIFRRQADRSRGVEILMQLTGWPRQKIENILIDGGYNIDLKEDYKAIVQYEETKSLYQKGWTDKEIANYFGCNPGTIKRWRKKHGFFTYKDMSKTRESIEHTIKLYKEGMRMVDIAEKLGVSKNCVSKRIRKWKDENNL